MTTATYYDQYTVLNLSAYSYAQTSPDLGINLNGSKDFSVDAWVNFNGLCSSTSIIAKEGVFEFGLWGNTVLAIGTISASLMIQAVGSGFISMGSSTRHLLAYPGQVHQIITRTKSEVAYKGLLSR